MLVVDNYAVHDAIEEKIGPDVVVTGYVVVQMVRGWAWHITHIVCTFLSSREADDYVELLNNWLKSNNMGGDIPAKDASGSYVGHLVSGQMFGDPVGYLTGDCGSIMMDPPNHPVFGDSLAFYRSSQSGGWDLSSEAFDARERAAREYREGLEKLSRELKCPYDPKFKWEGVGVFYDVLEVEMRM